MIIGKTVNFLILYRPPPNRKNGLFTTGFLNEFSALLDHFFTVSDEILITGDFNLHMDSTNDVHARQLSELLQRHSLLQRVLHATHQDGHILDLVVSRDNNFVTYTSVQDLISDNHAVHCEERTYHRINAIDSPSFTVYIINSALIIQLAEALDALVEKCDMGLSSVLSKYAPVKKKVLTVRPFNPWIDDKVLSARKERCRHESRWRNSRLSAHREIFIQSRDMVCKLIYQQKTNDYINKIQSDSDNPKSLFSMVNTLMHSPSHHHFQITLTVMICWKGLAIILWRKFQ